MNREQLQAAKAHASKLAEQIAGPGARLDDIPPFLLEVARRYASAPGCEHLVRSPAQPMILNVYVPAWSCERCAYPLMAAQLGRDAVEDYTCDGCRRYLPDDPKSLAVIRLENMVIPLSLCTACRERSETREE